MILPVRLTPKSARDEIIGVEDHAGERVLKARVHALPEAGRANEALVIAGNADALSHLITQRVGALSGQS